jgi:hypothetical protein
MRSEETKPRQPPPPKEEGKGLVTAKQLRLLGDSPEEETVLKPHVWMTT